MEHAMVAVLQERDVAFEFATSVSPNHLVHTALLHGEPAQQYTVVHDMSQDRYFLGFGDSEIVTSGKCDGLHPDFAHAKRALVEHVNELGRIPASLQSEVESKDLGSARQTQEVDQRNGVSDLDFELD